MFRIKLSDRPLLTFLMVWIFGFFGLFAFDLFVEAHVFEWLQWNGTTKNDWFFVLWWGVVIVWAMYGLAHLSRRFRNQG